MVQCRFAEYLVDAFPELMEVCLRFAFLCRLGSLSMRPLATWVLRGGPASLLRSSPVTGRQVLSTAEPNFLNRMELLDRIATIRGEEKNQQRVRMISSEVK